MGVKVFEVLCEYCPEDTKEIITECQYVTSQDNTLQSIVNYFTEHCEQYEKDLKSVREVLTIVQNIKKDQNGY